MSVMLQSIMILQSTQNAAICHLLLNENTNSRTNLNIYGKILGPYGEEDKGLQYKICGQLTNCHAYY